MAEAIKAYTKQTFLFLQGPISPFFYHLAKILERRGHRVIRFNLCPGDAIFGFMYRTRAFRGRFSQWPGYITKLMEDEKVTDVLLLGEQRAYHKVAWAAAKARGIRIHATDFGYLRPDWITLEPDGLSGLSRFPREAAAIHALAKDVPSPRVHPVYEDSFFNQALWDIIYNLSNIFFRPLYPFYRSHDIYHPIPIYLGTGWRLLWKERNNRLASQSIDACIASKKPLWLLPMQMEKDFSIRAYSPFTNMIDVLEVVMSSFSRRAGSEDLLLIKLHPLDPGLRRWRQTVDQIAARHGISKRVFFLDGGSLPLILKFVKGVITVNSTAGLWAMRSGCPVITLGQAIYDICGLTFQGELDDFWTSATPPDAVLFDALVRALTATIQIRGVFYRSEGCKAGALAAADHLEKPHAEALLTRLTGKPATRKGPMERHSV